MYLGGGLLVGTERDERNPRGLLLVRGIELTIKRLNFSIDLMPRVNVIGGSQIFDFSPGVFARYVLIEKPLE